MVHMCGHTILHNYGVIIFCDGETSEIFLTTRALIYADLMGDYCDSWKVFTWRSGAQCDWTLWTVLFFRSDINWRFCEFLETFHNIACWEYETSFNLVGEGRLCPPYKFGLAKNFDIPAHLFLDI